LRARAAAENQSLLIYATTLGEIAALDLATGRLAWVLQPPPSLGTRNRMGLAKGWGWPAARYQRRRC